MSGPSKPPPLRAPRMRLDSLKTVRRATPRLARPAQKTTPQCANPSCIRSDVVEEDGKLICRSCGYVLSDVQITQELTFGEAANGAAVVQGVYVGANEESARNAGLGPSKLTGGMDSRQVTERNGQHHVNNLVGALRLSATQKDRAYRMWTLAMNQNFIQGRVTRHVAAVCLYIACRQDKECRLMLVDFSDLLQMNVFKLGQIYTSFVEALNLNENHINIGLVNPENLIHRFAQDLEFGADEHKIANEAVQILKRLDRDWITTGRRPAGICGAALILAARMNNYRRTVREVVYTAKVCEITINKRLDEFRYTDSSKLTVEEFRHHGENLAAVHDPPAFYQQFETKKKSRRTKATAAEGNNPEDLGTVLQGEELATGDGHPSPSATRRRADSSMPPPPPPIDPALLSGESEDHLRALAHAEGADGDSVENESPQEQEPVAGQKRKRGRKKGSKNKPLPQLPSEDIEDEITLEKEVESILEQPDIETRAAEAHQEIEDEENDGNPHTPPPTEESSKQSQEKAAEASMSTRAQLAHIPDTEIVSDSEFPNDLELENAILSEQEVAVKERIWVHENSDWLRTQQARDLRQRLAASAGTARVPKKRTRQKKPRIGDTAHYQHQRDEHGNLVGTSSPAESVKMMLSHRGYSKKLDYATVEKLFQHPSKSPSAATASERGSTRAASDMGSPTPVRTPSKLSQNISTGAREGMGVPGPSTQREPIVVEDNGSSEEDTDGSDDAEEADEDDEDDED